MSTRPRLLDLFCGAGGCSVGYYRAGFEVHGVDIEPHPDYPYTLEVADAMTVLADVEYCRTFDVIHASPPCQRYSTQTGHRTRTTHPDLIRPVQTALHAIGLPYVIENVEGARQHLNHPLRLCGSSFGLEVWRHRYFEVYPAIMFQPACEHRTRPWTVTGDHADKRESVRPGTKTRRGRKPTSLEHARQVMGIEWMQWQDLVQAVPPVYTEYIGQHLLEAL